MVHWLAIHMVWQLEFRAGYWSLKALRKTKIRVSVRRCRGRAELAAQVGEAAACRHAGAARPREAADLNRPDEGRGCRRRAEAPRPPSPAFSQRRARGNWLCWSELDGSAERVAAIQAFDSNAGRAGAKHVFSVRLCGIRSEKRQIRCTSEGAKEPCTV